MALSVIFFFLWLFIRALYYTVVNVEGKSNNDEKQNVDFFQFDDWYGIQNNESEMKHMYRERRNQNVIITRTTSCVEKDKFEGLNEGLAGFLTGEKYNIEYYLMHKQHKEFFDET